MSGAADYQYMARALRLAGKGLYTTHPNPRVGCVLVQDGEVVGEGFHQRAGEPHAERLALAMAGDRARGATAYVTLEPCCHHGRTPPCSEGLIEAGVRRVVTAMRDPNPLVAGRGLEQLRRAGIEVDSGVQEAEASALNPGFVRRMQCGRPFVRCKLAMSLDGRTAMASGESKWITGPAARADVQRLRARSDAIVTGIGTVLADDPAMNVRLDAAAVGQPDLVGGLPQPLRVVLDPCLETPPTAKIIRPPGKALLLCTNVVAERRALLQAAGAEVSALPGDAHRLELEPMLLALGERQINEVLIESGPTLAGAAVAAGLVDQLVIYAAPSLMGDAGRGLLHLPGLERMRDKMELEILDLRQVGGDIRILLRPTKSGLGAAEI